jgi:hypothetical protein
MTSKPSRALPAGKVLEEMSNFWIGPLAAQPAAFDVEPASRRQRVLSVVAGIALAFLIGGGLFILAALTS